ncbi:MAG TPA: TIGR00645 family protein [Gammaproteobacteria bacterium]|nr:TIGR00645 family protein [Gammaproteobacteria bacterium]
MLNEYRGLSKIIFGSRWLQAPLYVGLIFAQCVYVYQFMIELYLLIKDANHHNEAHVMLHVLGLIDVVMIANLIIMVIVGGYETFVTRIGIQHHPDLPEWLDHVNSGTLKIKLSTALIGISSIHLLKTFINAENIEPQVMLWQVVIHLTFVISAILLAITDKIMNNTSIKSRKHSIIDAKRWRKTLETPSNPKESFKM